MSKSESDVKLVITPGEPAGIGPDLAIQAAHKLGGNLLIVADPRSIAERAATLGIRVSINDWSRNGEFGENCLNVLPVALKQSCRAGELGKDNAPYVIESLEQAVSLCEAGTFDGLVTGPVNKAIINEAGIPFSGHTEWLAERTGARRVVMMLATEGLRVALATTHLPLREVADVLDGDMLHEIISVVNTDLRDKFGLARPAISVCGLNPHAGEKGHLGREEIDIIQPTITRLQEAGLDVSGPWPADTAFTPAMIEGVDAVIAMYHDQGLPVLKYKGFGNAVNITLGLPIIRTSVDHGTALDLAGKGTADPQSLFTAIEYARKLALTQQA